MAALAAPHLSVKQRLAPARTKQQQAVGGRCGAIADWAESRLEAGSDRVVDRIDPQKLPLSLIGQPLPRAAWQNLETRLDRADAFLVVTPEYNPGYPAALKQVIDAVRQPWRAKPVGFVSYGGGSGGIPSGQSSNCGWCLLNCTR